MKYSTMDEIEKHERREALLQEMWQAQGYIRLHNDQVSDPWQGWFVARQIRASEETVIRVKKVLGISG